jgi:hypothetical protein
MPISTGNFSLSMSRRLGAAMALSCATLLLVVSLGTAHALRGANERAAMNTVSTQARGYARELRTRLGAGELVVQAVSGSDAGANGGELRARILRSGIFRGVVVATPGNASVPLPLVVADQLALSAGQTLLRARNVGGVALYLLHAVRAGGTPAVAYFELNPDWLWEGRDGVASTSGAIAVLGSNGIPLRASEDLPSDLLSMFAREQADAGDAQSEPLLRSWSAARREWRGAVVELLPEEVHLSAGRWAVIASVPLESAWDDWVQALGVLPVPILLAAFLILATCAALRARWEPVLEALRAAISELAAGRYQRVPTGESRDAPRATAVAFNRTIGVLEEKMRALASLNEIDRMLLESAELESCLDPLLDRVCKITGCDAAMLALLDPDATDYGRAYLTASGEHAPVSRISLDPLLLSQLCQEHSGLTVGRFEAGRHSVLEPLRGQGAEFFWLWPVISQDKLVAVLAVGYRDMPKVAAEVAGYGTECAARIGVALSNSARGEQLYRQAHFDPLTALPNRLLFRDRLSQELASAAAGRRAARCCTSISITSSASTTPSATAPATRCCRSSRSDCAPASRTATRSRASAAMNSPSSCAASARPRLRSEIATRVIESCCRRPVNIGGRDHQVRRQHRHHALPRGRQPHRGIAAQRRPRDVPGQGQRTLALAPCSSTARWRAPRCSWRRAACSARAAARVRAVLPAAIRAAERIAGRARGAGALAAPARGLRYPKDFVPAAEQSGLIVEIGTWVLESRLHAAGAVARGRHRAGAPGAQRIGAAAARRRLRAAGER